MAAELRMRKKVRRCACGCGRKFSPYRRYQVYATDACRQKGFYERFKEEHGTTPHTARQEAIEKASKKKGRK